MLRAFASFTISRTCVKQIEMAGVTLMPDDKVMMSTTLASNDPDLLENRTEIHLGRKHRNLDFGTGLHSCVGLRQARKELINTHPSAVMQQESVTIEWNVDSLHLNRAGMFDQPGSILR